MKFFTDDVEVPDLLESISNIRSHFLFEYIFIFGELGIVLFFTNQTMKHLMEKNTWLISQ